jgi:DNA polymerase IV
MVAVDDAPTSAGLWTTVSTDDDVAMTGDSSLGSDAAPAQGGAGEPDGSGTLVGHVDIDAFFAAVEQRDKPSLRSRPVIVGGVGPRGVVATASYEARHFGVFSAMPMGEARRRCPSAAILAGRFEAYRASSDAVMTVLGRHSPQVEQVSLDEAYLTLPATRPSGRVDSIREEIRSATGLSASVGVGTTKLVAKIASDDAKPDGVLIVPADAQAYLDALPVRRLPGLGPQTEARLRRLGIATVRQLRDLERNELTGLLGEAHGTLLWRLSHGHDERRVQTQHETKSVSVEETFDTDLADPVLVSRVLMRMSEQVAARLRAGGVSGRTVSLKARYPDFTTVSRSVTRAGPTDDARTIARLASTLMGELDLARGVRLLGVGCSGLTSWVQDDLFDEPRGDSAIPGPTATDDEQPTWSRRRPGWLPGQDVEHDEHGRGWVWGSGAGVVTVRFESRRTDPGPVKTFSVTDPALRPTHPEPLVP